MKLKPLTLIALAALCAACVSPSPPASAHEPSAAPALGEGSNPAAAQADERPALVVAQADPEPEEQTAPEEPAVIAPVDDNHGVVGARTEPTTCTYTIYNWSTETNRAVNRRQVSHAYSEIEGDERDPNDPRCTVCEEDQVTINTAALGIDAGSIQVCWAHQDAVERALTDIVDSGQFEFTELVGYRPGRTRGRVVDGVRTEMSNHAYGTAIDVNANHNALYRSCNVRVTDADSIANCTRGVGGTWDPGARPRTSVVRDGVVFTAFTDLAGWLWGGDISGSTRDLMHFSLTGY
jgi:hypothetical protein